MPSKKQDAITVSFAKKNMDVLELLTEYKKSDRFVQNDYVCDAIRHYERHKNYNFNSDIDESRIIQLIDQRFEELKKQLVTKEIDIEVENEEFDNEILDHTW